MKKFVLMMLVCTGLAVVSASEALAWTWACTWDNGSPVNTTWKCSDWSSHCTECSCDDFRNNSCYSGFTCYECERGFKVVYDAECEVDDSQVSCPSNCSSC